MKKDFGIIGAGPAGYTAAIRAAQLGKSVVLFEKEFLGGTCLNKGCIPTKAILRSVEAYNSLKKISNFGVNVENYSLDFEKVMTRKNTTVEKIRKSLETLLKSYGIEIILAEAKIIPCHCEEGVNGLTSAKECPCHCEEEQSSDAAIQKIEANDETYECSNVLIATGAEPKCVGGFEFDHEFILSSDDVLELKELPKKVVIVGSGAIGIEWARIFSSFGVEVSVVEIADRLLPLADAEISERLARTFKMARIKTFLSTSIKSISGKNTNAVGLANPTYGGEKLILNKKVELSSGVVLEPDFVLFATGRKPLDVGLANPAYAIDTLTPNPSPLKWEGDSAHLCAFHLIGDCYGSIQLAHFASHQAVQIVNKIVLGEEEKEFITPAVVYGHPEIAWIGKTEQELEKIDTELQSKPDLSHESRLGLPTQQQKTDDALIITQFKKSVFPLSALGKAQCDGDLEGFVKILADNDGNLLGAHIIGAEASALIHQLSIAMQNGVKVKDLKHCCFAHPTYSEGVYEALLGLDNESLSLLNSNL